MVLPPLWKHKLATLECTTCHKGNTGPKEIPVSKKSTNDLKTYVRRFQELAVLCPTLRTKFSRQTYGKAFVGRMHPEALKEKFDSSENLRLWRGGSHQSLLLKTKEDNIISMIMCMETNNHKRKFEDKR
ncbi:reverse transcriptase domain-containing protein [Tanacetum coccineum]